MKKLVGIWLMITTISCSAMEQSDDGLVEHKVIIDGRDIIIHSADNNQPIGVAAVAPEKSTTRPDYFDLNEAFSKNCETPLMVAAKSDQSGDLVKTLLVYGACVNQANQLNGWTPLHYACHYGYPPAIEELIKHGASVNAVDNIGYPPLFRALGRSYKEVEAFLKANQARKEQQ